MFTQIRKSTFFLRGTGILAGLLMFSQGVWAWEVVAEPSVHRVEQLLENSGEPGQRTEHTRATDQAHHHCHFNGHFVGLLAAHQICVSRAAQELGVDATTSLTSVTASPPKKPPRI